MSRIYSVRPPDGTQTKTHPYTTQPYCAWRKWYFLWPPLVSKLIRPLVGVYSTGPVWGKIVDSRGPRILMVASFTLLLLGYSGIRHVYDAGLKDDQSTITTFTLCMLALFGFMTGAGGNSALSGAVNSTAKSFPERLVRVN